MKSVLFSAPPFLRLSLTGELAIADLGTILPETRPPMSPNAPATTDHPPYDLLADLSQVTNIDCSFAGIAALVRARQTHYDGVAPHDRPPKRVVIWAPEDLPFGICRMLEQLVHGCLPIEMSVVREESEALSILHLAQDYSANPAEGFAETAETSNSPSTPVGPGIIGLPQTA